MKKYISLGMLLIMFNVLVRAEHYYYYHGEKIPLIVSLDSITIYTKPSNVPINSVLDSIVGYTIPIGNLEQTINPGTGRALLFYTNTNTQCLTLLDNRVGIGTQNPRSSLDVNGSIRAKEILVETTGADFVFADNYHLRPLSEVKTFIAENKHLPEIQSAKEMQENGVSVSELQTKLLQKIEELTLYILQQEERIKALEAELNK